MLAAFYCLAGVFLLLLLFMTVIHPFVCVVECAISRDLTVGQKIIWCLVLLCLGCVGSLVYIMMGTYSIRLRQLSFGIVTVAIACLIASVAIGIANPEVRNIASNITETIEQESLETIAAEFQDLDKLSERIDQITEPVEEPEFKPVAQPISSTPPRQLPQVKKPKLKRRNAWPVRAPAADSMQSPKTPQVFNRYKNSWTGTAVPSEEDDRSEVINRYHADSF